MILCSRPVINFFAYESMGGNILNPWVHSKHYGAHGVWFSYKLILRHNLPIVCEKQDK